VTGESVITYHAKDHTNHWSFLKFHKIPRKWQNSMAKGKFRGSARNSAACRKLWALLIDIPEWV